MQTITITSMGKGGGTSSDNWHRKTANKYTRIANNLEQLGLEPVTQW